MLRPRLRGCFRTVCAKTEAPTSREGEVGTLRPKAARGLRHWIRLHGFDGWQILGTAGLLISLLGFSILVTQFRNSLPHTGSGFLLTVLGGTPHPSDEAQLGTTSSPSGSPTGLDQAPVRPSASRSGVHPVTPSAGGARGGPTPSSTASASPSDSPTPRPVVHPSASPTPTPTPRPSVH